MKEVCPHCKRPMPRTVGVKKVRTKPRKGRVRDKIYLAWVARQPCVVTGQRSVTVHHVRRYGEPKNDRRTIPLVAELHMRTRELPGRPCIERGKAVFEKAYGINIEAEIARLNALYERESA